MSEPTGPQPAVIDPETRDWTVVIESGCAECGFVAPAATATGERLRATIAIWQARLSAADARRRPAPTTWSPVEYACHVRDVCRLFRQRLQQMLTEHNPVFSNWDQDAAALADDYFHADPATVAAEYAWEAHATADAFDAVPADAWDRPGRRSDGKAFTVATFAVYLVHDLEHHVHDVTSSDR